MVKLAIFSSAKIPTTMNTPFHYMYLIVGGTLTCMSGTPSLSISTDISFTHPIGTLKGEKSHTTADTESSFTSSGSLSRAQPSNRLKGIFSESSTYKVQVITTFQSSGHTCNGILYLSLTCVCFC